jgi:acylphosphatase
MKSLGHIDETPMTTGRESKEGEGRPVGSADGDINSQADPWSTMECERAKITVLGAVQGVGFRPFVYRLATQLRLNGWVLNSSQGVFIEVEGPPHLLQTFLVRLEKEKPPLAIVQSLECSFLEAVGC